MNIQWETYTAGTAGTPAVLHAEFQADPDEWIALHGIALKTSSAGRDIYRVSGCAGDADVAVKTFDITGFKDTLRWRMGWTAPQKEWRMLTHCADNDVPVPHPIAFGWVKTEKCIRVWLLCAFGEGCITFDALPPPRDTVVACRFARQLSVTIAAMHAAGICHRDLHAGNILYCEEESKWLLTDFQHAGYTSLSRKDLVYDIVQLNHCMGKKVPLRVRVTFLNRYLTEIARITSTPPLSRWERRSVMNEIARQTRRYTISQGMSRRRRYMRSTREIARLESWEGAEIKTQGFFNGFIRYGVSRQVISDLLNILTNEQWFLDSSITLMKNTRSVAAGVWSHPQMRLFVKQYKWRSTWRDKLSRIFGRSKAHRAWCALWRFRQLHIRVPAPAFVCEKENGGYIAQEYVDARSIEAALRMCEADGARVYREKVIRAAAREIGLMHDRGVAHGDLKASNVFVAGDVTNEVTIYLSDVDAARFYHSLPWHHRVRDLARLYAALYPFISNAESRLFLREYIRRHVTPVEVRPLIEAVQARAERKIHTKHGMLMR